MKTLYIIIVSSLIFSCSLMSQKWMDYIPDQKKENPSFYDIQKAYNEYAKFKEPAKIEGVKPYKRWESFMQARINEFGEFPAGTYWNEYTKVAEQRNANPAKNVNWSPVGPFDIPEYMNFGIRVGLGRIDCIAFHPFDENVVWIGAPAGGAWKTNEGGESWQPMTDNLPTIGVSDIIYHPTNPDIMYMATGERDAWSTFSIGVLKSIDGGDTWETTGLDFSIPDLKSVNMLLMNSTNPEEILAATNAGIYNTVY